MIVETIIVSLAAIVLGGTWMGLKFAKEFDPELRKLNQEKKKAQDIAETASEIVKTRKKTYAAIDDSDHMPASSRELVKTQVTVFPHAFSEEERKRLIKWANYE